MIDEVWINSFWTDEFLVDTGHVGCQLLLALLHEVTDEKRLSSGDMRFLFHIRVLPYRCWNLFWPAARGRLLPPGP